MDVLTETKTLAQWMVQLKIVKTIDEAMDMCQIGLVQLDGITCSNAGIQPSSGAIISTQNGYSYQIPILV
jgi:ribosomal 50S subunit-recycling heat shock protein